MNAVSHRFSSENFRIWATAAILCCFAVACQTGGRKSDSAVAFRGGKEKFRTGDFSGAVSDFSHAVELDSTNDTCFLLLGKSRLELKDFAGAIQEFSRGLNLNPSNNELLVNRGIAHHRAGNPSLVVSDFDAVIGSLEKSPVSTFQILETLPSSEFIRFLNSLEFPPEFRKHLRKISNSKPEGSDHFVPQVPNRDPAFLDFLNQHISDNTVLTEELKKRLHFCYNTNETGDSLQVVFLYPVLYPVSETTPTVDLSVIDQVESVPDSLVGHKLLIRFSQEGKERFRRLSASNVGKTLAILIDGNVVTAPVVLEEISGGWVELAGDFSKGDVDRIASGIRNGKNRVTAFLHRGEIRNSENNTDGARQDFQTAESLLPGKPNSVRHAELPDSSL